MKHLLLLRHAEAEESSHGAGDFDRKLTERGHSEALEAAAGVAATALNIDTVLASPARRARDTICIIAARLGLAATIEYEPGLYLGSPDTLLQALRRGRADTHCALLVGHNPGISELAQQLDGGVHAVALRTAGLCHLTFTHTDWIALGTRNCSSFVIVR